MNNRDLEDLQVKVSFLEEALNKLSDEHYAQQKELELLKLSHATVLETLRNQATGSEQATSLEDEIPPHY